MTCPFCNSAAVLPTKYTQEYECGTFVSMRKYRKTALCIDRETARTDRIKDRLKDLENGIATLRQNRDDWRRCAEMLKAALEPENCPEGGEAFGDVVKSARGLFKELSEKGNG